MNATCEKCGYRNMSYVEVNEKSQEEKVKEVPKDAVVRFDGISLVQCIFIISAFLFAYLYLTATNEKQEEKKKKV